jgi:hypothetical protein
MAKRVSLKKSGSRARQYGASWQAKSYMIVRGAFSQYLKMAENMSFRPSAFGIW